jgi:hypothetical protein
MSSVWYRRPIVARLVGTETSALLHHVDGNVTGDCAGFQVSVIIAGRLVIELSEVETRLRKCDDTVAPAIG